MIPGKLINRFAQTLAALPIAASSAGRDTLLIGLPEGVIAALNRNEGNRIVDLKTILMQLEPLGRVKGTGERPLLIVAQNALYTVSGTALGDSLEDIARELADLYGGKDLPSDAVPPVPEVLVVAGRDERLPYSFVEGAFQASKSIARLLVPRVLNGRLMPDQHGFGTGWVAAPGVLITNHHVITARVKGEPAPSAAEFAAQAAGTRAWFDYYREGRSFAELFCTELLAADPSLDYAVIRFESVGNIAPRPSLTIAKEKPAFAIGARLNIIQHSGGGPLRYAIRSNFYVGTGDTPDRLRYLTNTEEGASGSPVLDDTWQVVAMHHAYQKVPPEVFKGETVKFHNQGVIFRTIFNHLPSSVRNEVSHAQGW